MFARAALVLVALTALAPAARAADTRELKARESFAAGRYQEAVDLYAKLYAETLHPTYLRNIGRCYQNLEQPEMAIKSFREYLRKAKVTPAERAEVERFIREMEVLRLTKGESRPAAAAAPTAPPAAAAPPAGGAPPTPAAKALAPQAPSSPVATPQVDLSAQPAEPAPTSPFYTRWWFWTGIAVVAAGAVTAYVLVSRRGGAPDTDYGPYTPSWK